MEEHGQIMLIKIVLVYYILINAALFASMGIDKRRALKSKWRIPESRLFALSVAGGALGGFAGMFAFHHKTKKPVFYAVFFISLIFNAFIMYKILGLRL